MIQIYFSSYLQTIVVLFLAFLMLVAHNVLTTVYESADTMWIKWSQINHGWILIPVPLGFLHLDPSLVFLQAYLVQNCGGLDISDPFEK